VAVEGGQLVFLRHGEAVGGAVFHAVAAEDADAKVDGVVLQLLFPGLLVHHPVHHRQVDGADPDAHLTGDALVELEMNPTAVALGGDQLFVGILNRHRTAAHMVEGDRQPLGDAPGRSGSLTAVITHLLEKSEHGDTREERDVG